MKKSLFLFLFLLFIISSKAQETKLKGIYKGQNLYILNTLDEVTNSYCISEILVNGTKYSQGLVSSAFELNFADFGLVKGDPILIILRHKKDCKVDVVNILAISGTKEYIENKDSTVKDKVIKHIPEPTNEGFGKVTGTVVSYSQAVKEPKRIHSSAVKFEIVNADVNSKNILNWETRGEKNILPFVVEQYRWNRWVFVCEVKGYGAGNENKYEINVIPHPGNNKFRISQKGNFGEIRYSDVIPFSSEVKPIKLDLSKIFNVIKFPKACLFEIYDTYGNMVLTGFSYHADLRKLDPGKYFINYDNVTKEFKRRKSKKRTIYIQAKE